MLTTAASAALLPTVRFRRHRHGHCRCWTPHLLEHTGISTPSRAATPLTRLRVRLRRPGQAWALSRKRSPVQGFLSPSRPGLTSATNGVTTSNCRGLEPRYVFVVNSWPCKRRSWSFLREMVGIAARPPRRPRVCRGPTNCLPGQWWPETLD